MSVYQAFKDAISLAQQADNFELQQQLLDLQAQAQDMQGRLLEKDERIKELEEEADDLRESLKLKKDLKYLRGHYFEKNEAGHPEGEPYCSRCWEMDNNLVHMNKVSLGERKIATCPECDSKADWIKMTGNQG